MSDYSAGEHGVRQLAQRARSDRQFVHQVLDEGWVAHVSFIDDGAPMIIPIYYVRDGERLLMHGSRKARVMRVLSSGVPLALCVTLLDALVLARSAFHHSMNYRSVIVHGRAVEVTGEDKVLALDLFIERFEAGRAAQVRRANASEDKATMVLAVPLVEVAAKTRSGPPMDDAEDMALAVSAGLRPIHTVLGDFEVDR